MFKDIKKKIDKAVRSAQESIVDHTVDVLIRESPVWTGDFVKSHIAESSSKSYPRAQFMGGQPYPPKADPSAVKSAAKPLLKESAKSILIKNGKVSINNKSKHANFVEYLGWEMPGTTDSVAGTIHAPKMPFSKTKESVKLQKKSIISAAVHKVFRS